MRLLLLAALAAPLAPASQLSVEGQTISVREVNDLISCRFNRILPDPTSGRVVVWYAPRDLRGDPQADPAHNFVMADLASEGSGGPTPRRLAFVGAMVRVEPLRWNASGDRLLVRVGGNGAVLLDPGALSLSAAPALDPLWSAARITAISHGDLDFYRRAGTLASLRRIERDGAPVRTAATVDRNTASFLILRYGNNFEMTGYEGQRRWETGLPISFASAPLLPPGTRRPLFMGDQTGYRTFLPYAMPLVDLSSGRIIGRFGWERIEFRDGEATDLGPHFRQLTNIRDAAANGDTVIALVDLEREERVVRVRGNEVRSWTLCEKRGLTVGSRVIPALDALPAEVPVLRSEIRFTPGRASADPGPFGQLYRPVNADGRLIVRFHGGPTATLAEDTVPQEVAAYTPRGISVLNVEYSGMLGGGLALTERLPQLGLQALRQDLRVVTAWVRGSGFREVFLLADSFGGSVGAIAATDYPGDYAHVFMRAPFLALRDPVQSVRRGEFLSRDTRPNSQLEFEQMVYGGAQGRARLGAELQAYVQRLRPSPRLSFYFGGIDPVSAVTDLPPAFAGDPSVIIVPRTAHEFVAADRRVRDDILSKIDHASSEAPAVRR